MPDQPTKQLNLRVEPEYEDLVRETVAQIRRGGPPFRNALTALIANHEQAIFMIEDEIIAHFDRLEARVARLESRLNGGNDQP